MSTPATPRELNPDKLNQLLGKMVNDLGAAASSALVLLGDQLGLFKALRELGSATSRELADRAGVAERYVREWLACQAASGYIQCEPESGMFSMSPEQVAVFADPDSPASLTGGYYSLATLFIDAPKIADAFRSGRGVSWGEHHPCLFCGTAKFFRPGYMTYLIPEWIPSLDGVKAKLEAGIKVADIGCGFGVSTLIMAKAFPKSQFIGFDIHPDSVLHARKHAEEQGLTNVTFEAAAAKDVPGTGYGFVTIFDALHDMGDPIGAAKHIREILSDDGTWMVVEPMAGNSLAENLNPVSRIYYAFSTMICVPASLSQEVGLALGAQAGESRLKDVMNEGGFSRVRRSSETPFNMILEARP